MHITSMQFDAEFHKDIIEHDTTSAFIAEKRVLIGQSTLEGEVAIVELHFVTYSYHPEMVQQWARMPARSLESLNSSVLFEVMVQAKPDGTMKITHVRHGAHMIPWCTLLDAPPSS